MRTLLLTALLIVVASPALANDPAESPATESAKPEAPASTAPLQGEIRFHVEGMKKAGDGF